MNGLSPKGSQAMCRFLPLSVIILSGALLYGYALGVPWYLDDVPAIVENQTVRNLSQALQQFFSARGPVTFTFAINYYWSGLNTTVFHATNIAIHLLTSCLVYSLLKRFFPGKVELALFGALIFLAHPLQTQSVNYIVQRMTLLAAFGFFLAIYAFIRYREGEPARQVAGGLGHVLWLGVALLSGILAILSKQNAVVLPVALLLVNWAIYGDSKQLLARRYLTRNLILVAGLAAVAAMVAWRDLLSPLLSGRSLSLLGVAEDLSGGGPVNPLHYFITEFSVLWLYLRLLFLPYGQMLEYGYPLAESFWAWSTLAAGVGLLALLVLAWRVRQRVPWLSFALGWFFLTLAVESSFIPLDPVNEHRLYLPMFGFAVFCSGCLRSVRSQRWRWLAGTSILLICAFLTLQRNQLWHDPVLFWRDNVQKSTLSYRAVLSLADAYYQRGQTAEAARVYEEYLPGLLERRTLLLKNPNFLLNVGVSMQRVGKLPLARRYLEMALHANPGFAPAYYNLGVVHYNSGDKVQALNAFARARSLAPMDADNLFNWAFVAFELGDPAPAQTALPLLRYLDGKLAIRLESALEATRSSEKTGEQR